MERQRQNAPIQIDDSNHPRFTHTAEGEEPITEAAAQTIFDSPPSTIPFDEDSPPRRPPSERLSPAEEAGDQYVPGPSAGRKRKRDVVDDLSFKSDREMCQSLFRRIDQLKRENRRLQQSLEEQKARKSLECPLCWEEKEKWLSVQCGHIICSGCILDLLKQEALFNRPCPLCQVPVKSLAECYPNLR